MRTGRLKFAICWKWIFPHVNFPSGEPSPHPKPSLQLEIREAVGNQDPFLRRISFEKKKKGCKEKKRLLFRLLTNLKNVFLYWSELILSIIYYIIINYIKPLVFKLDIAILFQSIKILKKMDHLKNSDLLPFDQFEKFLFVQVRIVLLATLSSDCHHDPFLKRRKKEWTEKKWPLFCLLTNSKKFLYKSELILSIIYYIIINYKKPLVFKLYIAILFQ